MTSVFRKLIAVAVLLAVAGCAGMNKNPRDPLEPLNRNVAQFNEGVDAIFLKPVATAYRNGVPPLVRTGVSNFFSNLRDGWSFVNSLLQLKVQNAADDFARFGINTFVGIGGIFDVASELDIERHREDFGQTLGRWGMPSGPYVVLPLLGPSTLRDSLALVVDHQGDPVGQVNPWHDRYVLYGLRAVDERANLLRVGNVIDQAALDKYSFTRDAYLQKRRADIFEDRQSDTDGDEPREDDGQIPPEPAGQPASAPKR